MLRPGGTLVYSTCTFSPEENEGVISAFLQEHDDFTIEESALERFFAPGRADWVENPADSIAHTMRLWPHKIAGEGHFIAKLKKEDGLYAGSASAITEKKTGMREKGKDRADAAKQCRLFLQEELAVPSDTGVFTMFGDHFYLVPAQMIPLQGLSILRPGLHVATQKKKRFEPAHALALHLSPGKTNRCYEMTKEQAQRYLRGETFSCDAALKGWMLLVIDGYAIGFGKAGGGQMKNHYPKGLRK